MSDSVGKITLDLEVTSDLMGQINAVSGSIGRRLRESLSNALKIGLGRTKKDTDMSMKYVKDKIMSNMKAASNGVGLSSQSMMKNTSDMIKKTFSDAGSVARNVMDSIGERTKRMTQSIMKLFKMRKMPTVAPVNTEDTASKVKSIIPRMASPRAPPSLNIDLLKSQMETIEKTMDTIERSISAHKEKLRGLRESYEHAFSPKIKETLTEKILREESAINSLIGKMDTLTGKYATLESQSMAFGQTESATGAAAGVAGSRVSSLSSILNRLRSSNKGTPSLLNRIAAGFKSIGQHSKSSGVSVSSFGGGLKSTLGQMLKWMIILPMIVKGIKAFASNMVSCLKTNDQFNNSLKQIYTNLWVAFMPIYNAILPAINALMAAIARLSAYLASFINGLFGKTYSSGLDAAKGMIAAKDAAGAYGGAAGKASKASKELQRSLLGIDELNRLSDNSDSDSDSGGAPELVASPDMSALDAATMPWVQKFKELMAQIFRPFKAAWDREGQATIASMRYALENVWELIKSIGKSFLEVWTNGTGEEILARLLQILQTIFGVVGDIAGAFQIAWETGGLGTSLVQSIADAFLNILTLIRDVGQAFRDVWNNGTGVQICTTILDIFKNIFETIGNVAQRLTDAWNQNENGTRIIQGILDLVQTVLGFVERIAGATAEWASKIDFGPLLQSIADVIESIQPVLQEIGKVFGDIWESIILPALTWLIETGIPTALELLSKVFDFLGEHEGIITVLITAVLTFIATFGGLSIVTGIVETVGGAFKGLLGVFGTIKHGAEVVGAAFSALSSPIGIAIAAIAAIIAIGVLLWKNWDTIKEVASNVWSFVTTTFDNFRQFLSGIFSTDWSVAFGMFGDVLNGFLANAKNIIDNVKTIFDGIITFIKGVFSGNWRQAWDGVIQIFSGIMGGLASVAKAPFNALISLVNSAISALNTIHVDIPDWVPGVGGKSFGIKIPKIPYLAKGGVIDQPTLAMMGEQGKKEAVVPLERNLGWRDAIVDKITEELDNGENHGQGFSLDELMTRLRAVIMEAVKLFAGMIPQQPRYNADSGDIVIPIYLDGGMLDEVIITAQQRKALRSGGR